MYHPKYLFATLLLLTFAFLAPLTALAEFVVVIDPGHGGKDPGTLSRKGKQNEKTIALNVAQQLGYLIQNSYGDVRVVYTRTGDTYPDLTARVEKAKKVNGDLYISIHVNACANASTKGFETYIFGVDGTASAKARVEERLLEERENLDLSTGKQIDFDQKIDAETAILCRMKREIHNKQSREVAEMVQQAMIAQLRKSSYSGKVVNRGILARNFFVLCFAPMPAILVEMGYMSNAAEERFIASSEGQTALAKGIYNGFCKYKAAWDKRKLDAPQPSAEEKPQAKPEQPQTKPEQPQTKPQQTQTKPQQPNQPAKTSSSLQQVTGTGKEVYRIQFLSGDKMLPKGSREFKGLSPVTYTKEKNKYRYFYGCGTTTKELAEEKKKVNKLFPEAFFVKFDAKGNRTK